MTLTKKDLQQIVKALDPKFKKIDKRFEQIDQQFKQVDKNFEQVRQQFQDGNIEIGGMFQQLATKVELKTLENEVALVNDRLDEFVDQHEQFAGNMSVFQSKTMQHFDQLEADHKAHTKLIQQGFSQIGNLSTQVRHQEQRLAHLEKTA